MYVANLQNPDVRAACSSDTPSTTVPKASENVEAFNSRNNERESSSSPQTAALKKKKSFFSIVPQVDSKMLRDAYGRERSQRIEHEKTIQNLLQQLEIMKDAIRQLQQDHHEKMDQTIRTFQEHVDGNAANVAELNETLRQTESENRAHVERGAAQQQKINSLRSELAIAKSKIDPATFAAVNDRKVVADNLNRKEESQGGSLEEQVEALLKIRDKMEMQVNWETSLPLVVPKKWTGIMTDGKKAVKKIDLSGFGLKCSLAELSPLFGGRLVHLKLFENPELRGSLEILKGCVLLRSIAFQYCEEIDGDLSHLGNCKKLVTLDLRFTNTTGNLTNLSACTVLQYIDVRETHITGNIAVFGNCPALQVVLLGHSDVFGNIKVFESTPRLVYVDLCRCARITGDLSSLSHCTALQKLHITYTNAERDAGSDWIIDGDLACLASCKSLVAVDLENTAVWGMVESLRSCDHLHHLNLKNTRVTGENWESAARPGR